MILNTSWKMNLGPVILLRVAWIAGILSVIIAVMPCSLLSSYQDVMLDFARRGKTRKPSGSNNFTVPQRYFCHFYVLAVMWTTVLLLVTWIYANRFNSLDSSSDASKSIFLVFLMEIQVVRRMLETIYVFKYSPSARMHIFGYLTGLFFYTAAPLTLCCTIALEASKFVLYGAKELNFWETIMSGFNSSNFLSFLLKISLWQWIGLAVVLWGWIHQYRCHAILGALRKIKGKSTEYGIPYGDWFDFVSSPHYLAEIVIYGGIVICSGGMDINIWLLFSFVVANLSAAAAETHKWYIAKFDEYPRNRRAIIPFIY